MARVRSVDFLPEIFQTDANKQFLAATLDQLIQEPKFKKTQGYIGRKIGPGVNPNDKYVIEPSKTRNDYQLEPGIVSLNPDKTTEIKDVITYPGITDALAFQGADGTRPDRLYSSEYYTWDSFIDWDAFVNFSQYFWVPDGLPAVEIANSGIPTSASFLVTQSNNVYNFSGETRSNPTLQLVRGGNYSFILNQSSNFWIQSNPGVNGTNPTHPNISARNVYGVSNNGENNGTVVFNVPLKTAQDFYYSLTDIGNVDLVTDLAFGLIDGQPLDDFVNQYGGIDGITNLNGRTVIFTNPAVAQNIWQISYNVVGPTTYLVLTEVTPVNNLEQVLISFGTVYSNTQWFKNNAAQWEEVPLLTASLDHVYYQDGTNPDIFGRIDIIDQEDSGAIKISDIVGQKNYTSPNGVVFTNGLKVTFQKNTIPASYGSSTAAINIIETIAGLNLIFTPSTQNLAVNQKIVFSGESFGNIVSDQIYYVKTIFNSSQFTISTVPGGPDVILTTAVGFMTGIATQYSEYYVSGVGSSIELLPVANYVTPEIYAPGYNDNTTVIDPVGANYLTINRDSPDLNAWSRSNCWFHTDVVTATSLYNNIQIDLDGLTRAKRPIIQFRGGIRLFNMGTSGKAPVDTIDFTQTDAFSNVEGQTSYSVNGYTFVNGSRVIFAADIDPDVRNKIYLVNFVSPDTIDPLMSQPIINLVLAQDGNVLVDENTVVIDSDQIGKTFWYDGVEWIEAQEKIAVQQAPLFNIYDSAGVSLSDRSKYPSSDFVGSKLFSYALGDTTIDPVLGFQLRYLTIGNVGDIVFDNNFYADSFNFTQANTGYSEKISIGYPYEYSNRTVYRRLLGWDTAPVPTPVRQQFSFTYDGSPLVLDIVVLSDSETIVPAVQVYVGSLFQDPNNYSVTIDETQNTTIIALSGNYVIGDLVEVAVLSNQTSATGFYQVPSNLQQNPFNNNSNYFTLGTIRTHYESICQNLTEFTGKINGANNTRDLGNIGIFGQIILQQSSPLTLAGYFMRSNQYNIWGALEYNSREYQKYKNQMLEAVTRQVIQYQPAGDVLDTVIAEITTGRTDINPFYWSDMLPASSVFTTQTYTVSYITTNKFDTNQVYNYKSANYQGMNVYLNSRLLTRGLDYSVSTTAPTITILEPLYSTLVIGDVITIQEYTETYGSFVPNTPTKMGLYPAWRPQYMLVKTSSGSAWILQGHDGSQTPVFGDISVENDVLVSSDIRDQVLLEFETRIFNNLKVDDNPIPLTITDVLPGQFRTTGYSWNEINSILTTNLLSYVAWNKLNLNTQTYNAGNPFTYNYSQSLNRLNNEPLLGSWRGIYRYFYDTQQPELTPWEMLGFTVQPSWWEITYGPAPYTSDNLVLWQDLEAGLVRDPAGAYILTDYARPGLLEVIPTDSDGELLSPLFAVAQGLNEGTYQKSWSTGDGSPVEASWWNSSDYPFAVMRLLALTRPAQFFALFADRDLYRYQEEFGQYLLNDRYRLDANGVQIYGDGVSKASYIDWIIDYNRVLGKNSTVDLEKDLANLDVRMCYRMASFSDKQYIKIYTERSSPNSVNSGLLIPDDSYDMLIYKNQPFDRSIYSSVVVQVVENGYAVYGYSTARPFFNTLTAIPVGQLQTISVGLGNSVQVPANYSDEITQVPYGFVFTTQSAVVNFLLSYGQYLIRQGFTFTGQDNGYVLDWNQMSQEFLYWSLQGWGPGTLINLNPLAYKLTVTKEQAVVDTITAQTAEHVILDQNRKDFAVRDLNIVRIDNTFSIEPLINQSISYIDMRYTSFESMIVLNNSSLFGDLIYDPITGARQNRLTLVAVTSTEWNGSVDAQGFILNQNNIEEWTGLRTYTKGELVKYKGQYWSAAKIVQPSSKFNYNDWNQSDYTLIQQGLLPNIANKADQLANSYNINSANLESDNDLLSYGLIGFRPRQYLTALNLDDVSQLNVYRQFLDSKGTITSVDLIGQANFGKEAAQYSVYENWAILRATYGANANRSWFDLRLNRADLTSDPCLVQVVDPGQSSEADQAIALQNVWSSSYQLTSPDILPTTTTLPTDISLPTAGYVNLDDVDVTVFDLTDPASLSASIDTISVGTKIWVAKVNDVDWNIYRAQDVPGSIQHVCDNLNGTCRVIFSDQHGLKTGDKLIIKFFDTEINGVYTVISVASLTTVNIVLTLSGGRTVVDGNGIGFTLTSMRVAQASDIINLPYVNNISPGAQVWVDDNGNGLWEVLQKQYVFETRTELEPKILGATEQYGAAVAQSQNRSVLLVGAPNYGETYQGAIYAYTRTNAADYTPISRFVTYDDVVQIDATGVVGFGNALDFGTNNYAIAGASQSLGPNGEANNGYAVVLQSTLVSVTPTQLLLQPGTTNTTTPGAGEFGYSVAISEDENWIYVGAPGLNQVHAYGYVDIETQVISYFSDGVTDNVYFGDTITVDLETQISITSNGQSLALGIDYTIDLPTSTVTFINVPPEGYLIVVQRRSLVILPGGNTIYNVSNYLYTATDIYSITVFVGGVLQRPNVDYQYNGTNLTFFDLIPSSSVVQITSNPYYTYVDTISGGVLSTDRFGHSIKCSSDGSQVIIGCKNSSAGADLEAGSVYVFDRNVQKFLVLGDNIETVDSIEVGKTYTIKTVGTTDFTAIGAASNTVGTYFTATAALNFPAPFIVPGTSYVITVLGNTDFTAIGAASNTVGLEFVATAAGTGTGVACQGTGTVVSNMFMVANTLTAPTEVIYNGQNLVNREYTTPVATGTFSVVDSNTVRINGPVAVGDEIQIETNQFVQQQVITQQDLKAFSNFGQAVDLCPYDCSLYSGAPQYSNDFFRSGVVQRSINQARLNGTITATVANPVLTVGDTVRVNNVDCYVPAPVTGITSLQGLANNITANAPNASATVSADGYLTISVTNVSAALPTNKLQVSPGSVGTAFAQLGFETFVFAQTIESPYPVDYAAFGSALAINGTALTLAVGAPSGTLYLPTTFDYDAALKEPTTTFDGNSTTFYAPVIHSGVVYTYDYFPAGSTSTEPGNFVFGQQVGTNTVEPNSLYGSAICYNSGVLTAGAPGYVTQQNPSYTGAAFLFENPKQDLAWKVKYIQQPTVDVRLLNSVYMYDRVTSAKSEFFDFFNPLQGKILGAAQQNLDYIGAVDPAEYNVGAVNNLGNTWGVDHVGEMWWDISTVRFIDPNQDSIVYASRRWGQVFPGSVISVYQWVESANPPESYVGAGTPLNTTSYVINTSLTRDGTFVTRYYFWVKNVLEVYVKQGKTLNAFTVASYIESPRTSGIAYIAPINASTIAIYNGLEYIEAFDTIISIEFDQILNDANVHTEYELIPQGRADGFLSDNLYRKFQDSFCGVDTFGNKVPDPNLSPSLRYGVQFRPRQSMFVDRFAALKNYIVRANSVFVLYPMTESATFTLLNSEDPVPPYSSGEWDKAVATIEEMYYEYEAPGGNVPGYKYLVLSDSTQNGLWTIYTVQNNLALLLTRVQNYKTPNYWSYIDWYSPGYNPSTKVLYQVPNYATLSTLDVPPGGSVKVLGNQQGKWEIYLKTATSWTRVGLQDGTIELSASLYDYVAAKIGFDLEVFDSQYFDQEPVIETRKIIQAINEELFVGTLALERNNSLTMMFDFILSELQAPEWLTKTSLIDVDHKIRELIPYPNYVRDNQDFVIDYIQEVKPYHVQVRAFNLLYNGLDEYAGDVTDFDVPAYYNTTLPVPQYVSPILLPYAHSTYQQFNVLSDTEPFDPIWQKWPYSQWFENYLLYVDSIIVEHAGSGYTDVPVLTVEGNCVEQAELIANINGLGEITSIDVVNPGAGYSSTPTITIQGNGTGAAAYPVMANGLVRSFKTVIKFDRYQYNTSILTWSTTGVYAVGDKVRYDDRVWEAVAVNGPSTQFDLTDWSLVAASTLSGVDRTMGFYTASQNEPGLDLPLLIDGVDYPGVQVYGKDFASPEPLDAIYASAFTDILGVGTTAINVEGGQFVDTYEGHAPEELVNGAEYDTLDLRVYTRPGSDWTFNGHGFQIGTRRFVYQDPDFDDDADLYFYWGDVVDYPAQVLVVNATTNRDLTLDVDYTVDWIAQTIFPVEGGGISWGDVIEVDVYEVGGGSQLYRAYIKGNTVENTVSVPVAASEISEIAFFVNGQEYPGATWVPYYTPSSIWDINNSYNKQDIVTWGGFYWRAIQDVPAGIDIADPISQAAYWAEYTPTTQSIVTFPVTVSDTDGISIVVLGDPTQPSEVQGFDETPFDIGNVTNEPGSFDFSTVVGVEYSWSTPQVQYIVADAETVSTQILTLTNPIPGTNPANLVVTRNGLRLTPAAGIEWIGDDQTVTFGLPQRLGSSFSQGDIDAATDIQVYVDNVLLTYQLDYTVTDYDGTNDRKVVFAVPFDATPFDEGYPGAPGTDTFDFGYGVPRLGAQILITVSTLADYIVVPGDPNTIELRILPNLNDEFAVTTWNDTSQQDIVTLVFYGPEENAKTIILNEPYDSTLFDATPGNPIEWSLTTVIVDDTIANGSTSDFTAPSIDYNLVVADPSILAVYYRDELQTGNYTISDGSPGTTVTFYMPPEPYDSGDFDVGNSTDSSIFPNGSFDYDYLPPAAGNKVTLTATFPTTFPVDQIVYVLPVDDMIPPTFYRAIQNVPEGIDITNTAYWEVIDYVNVVGSFDYTEGIQIPLNNFFLNRPCATANRLWVTLNGFRLQEGREYTVENNYLILGSGTISPADILVVTEFTCSVVPDALAFRIFQDMRGIQSTYRITPSTTTLLSNSISATDDEIYVSNINALTQPNLEAGIFGVITIDGERIMYRDFDPFNSKISGLLRGTAGTAAASHAAGAIVYNMGRNNLLQPQYQDYIVENSMIADGVAYTYYAPDVTVNYDNQEGFDMLAFDVASINGQSGSFDFGTGDPTRAVLVYVGGILQTSGYALSFEPVVNVTFFTPPTAGYEITILARKGLSWYQPGIDASSLTPEPSNGVPLQETDTDAARFLRGLI